MYRYIEISSHKDFEKIELFLHKLNKLIYDKVYLNQFINTIRYKFSTKINLINNERYVETFNDNNLIYFQKYVEPLRDYNYEELLKLNSYSKILKMINNIDINNLSNVENLYLDNNIENFFNIIINYMKDNNDNIKKTGATKINFDYIGTSEPIFNSELNYFPLFISHRIILMKMYLDRLFDDLSIKYFEKFRKIGYDQYYPFLSFKHVVYEEDLEEKINNLNIILRKYSGINSNISKIKDKEIDDIIISFKKEIYKIFYFNQSFFGLCKKLTNIASLKNYFNLDEIYLDFDNYEEVLYLVTLVDVNYFIKTDKNFKYLIK